MGPSQRQKIARLDANTIVGIWCCLIQLIAFRSIWACCIQSIPVVCPMAHRHSNVGKLPVSAGPCPWASVLGFSLKAHIHLLANKQQARVERESERENLFGSSLMWPQYAGNKSFLSIQKELLPRCVCVCV